MSTERNSILHATNVVLPLMLATFVDTTSGFIANLFATRYANGLLCAALPASALAMTFVSVLTTIVALAGTIFAREHGAGRTTEALAAFRQGVLLAVLTLPLFLVAAPLGEMLLESAGHAPDIRAYEQILYRYQLVGGFALVLFTALSGFLSGQGRTRPLAVASMCGCLASAFLSAVLISGGAGLPALGVHGLGLAILAGRILPVLILLSVILRDPLSDACRRLGGYRPDGPCLAEILRKGIPSGLSILVLSGAFTIFTLAIGRLDLLSVTAINICFAINGFYWVFVQAAEQAVTILAGRALGAGDRHGAREALRQMTLILAVPLVLFFGFALLGSDLVTSALYDPAAGLDYTALCRTVRQVIVIFIVRDTLEAGCHLLSGVLTAALDTRSLLVIRLASNLVWITLIGLVFILHPAFWTYILLMPIQMALVFLPLFIRWRCRAP